MASPQDTTQPSTAVRHIPRMTPSEAAACLYSGGLVAIPTETVYGLAAHARNTDAIARVFNAKGRPESHPVIVHIAQAEQLTDWACEIPDVAWELAETFWPGPLTLILKRHPDTPLAITGGQDTVAIRIPKHPLALDLLTQLNDAVIAPSANRFGHISPTTPEHVEVSFATTPKGQPIEGLIDGGACLVGIESTILDVSDPARAVIRRPGKLHLTDLQRFLPQLEAQATSSTTTIRVPGQLDSHYAPTHPTYLVSSTALSNQATDKNLKTGFLGWSMPPESCFKAIILPPTPNDAANALYAGLHELDATCDVIWVEALVASPQHIPPPEWAGVWDRLLRATAGEYIPSDPSFVS